MKGNLKLNSENQRTWPLFRTMTPVFMYV